MVGSDVKGRADPLAEIAEKDNVCVFKFPQWRTKGKPLPEVSWQVCHTCGLSAFRLQLVLLYTIELPSQSTGQRRFVVPVWNHAPSLEKEGQLASFKLSSVPPSYMPGS